MRAEEHRNHHRIVMNPSNLTGKPTVRGTDILVDSVLSHLAENFDLNDLFAAYPRLSVEDVKAVLTYARDAVSHSHSTGSLWIKDLYDYFEPVRTEAERKRYSQEEIDDAIDRAVAAVRTEHA